MFRAWLRGLLRFTVEFSLVAAVGVGLGVGLAALERSGVVSEQAVLWTFAVLFVAGLASAFYAVRGLTAEDFWVWDEPDDAT